MNTCKSAHDAENVLLWNTIVQQGEHTVLNNVVEARAESTTCHNGSRHVRGVEVDRLVGTSMRAPLVHPGALDVLRVCKPS